MQRPGSGQDVTDGSPRREVPTIASHRSAIASDLIVQTIAERGQLVRRASTCPSLRLRFNIDHQILWGWGLCDSVRASVRVRCWWR
jgi:hypothetical protein